MNKLIIFAKNPLTEPVKTRLAATIGIDSARNLYRQFLESLINEHTNQKYKLIFCVQGSVDYFKKLEAKQQSGNSLGEKLFNVTKVELQTAQKIIIIGSDLPFITSKDINTSFKLLDIHDVVIGPAFDGGYYLIGLKQVHNLFSLKSWSHDKVFEQTMSLVKKLGLTYSILPKKRDIDTIEDLEYYEGLGLL